MTANGAMSATLFLMVLLVGAATFGWSSVKTIGVGEAVSFPSWAMIAFIVGFVSVLVATFKPTTARFLAPVYALAQGAVVGAISKVFNIQYPGIVLQAVGATIGVFVVMLTLYRTGILRVTDKFRRIVIGATLGLAAFYLFSFIAGFFGANLVRSAWHHGHTRVAVPRNFALARKNARPLSVACSWVGAEHIFAQC
jgi:uncharacterized YccA/Bax inhibitor family protein